jgi:hypothetical protein
LECGGFDAAFPFLDLSTAHSKESGVKAAALQRLPPILMSKLNASGVKTPGLSSTVAPRRKSAYLGTQKIWVNDNPHG